MRGQPQGDRGLSQRCQIGSRWFWTRTFTRPLTSNSSLPIVDSSPLTLVKRLPEGGVINQGSHESTERLILLRAFV